MPQLDVWAATLWNNYAARQDALGESSDADVGMRVVDGAATHEHAFWPHRARTEHLAILGRTGSGKSSLLKRLCRQDITAGRGFLFFDLHGDSVPELLSSIASLESEAEEDFSNRTVVLDPSDAARAVGLNLFAGTDPLRRFVEVSETVEILKRRWKLDALGARTEELLRNALLVTHEAGLTIVDLPTLLISASARKEALRRVQTPGVLEYFRDRYDRMSEAMQSVFREAVLNKVTVFTADPHFRHVLGQASPPFSLVDAVERGLWVFVTLPRGTLGVEADTFGSLILARLKDALFGRTSRTLFTIYADEFQQLASYDETIEELFAESRKFGVSVVAAHQYLGQLTPRLQAALQALGTQTYFQLSGLDAAAVARVLGGGPTLAETLAALPKREMVMTLGGFETRHVRVGTLEGSAADTRDLRIRIDERWARRRDDVERDIAVRHATLSRLGKESLESWE